MIFRAFRTFFITLIFTLELFSPFSAAHASIRLTWKDNSGNETKFLVWRKAQQGNAQWTLLTTVSANAQSYTDKSVRKNQRYCYFVTANNESGQSPASNQSCATAP